MTAKQRRATLLAVLAAALYAVNAPCSKLLLARVSPTMLAGLLYVGAGGGMALIGLTRRVRGARRREQPLSRKELPYVVAMILLDILAPILLMLALQGTSAASVSLLNNFEIVATSIVAMVVFGERVSKRLWLAIALVTLSGMLLCIDGADGFTLSLGALAALGACVCWGFENNCTRMLSAKDPLQIVVWKGFGSGLGSIGIALVRGEAFPQASALLPALLLGFVAYGLSIFCYVYAQRDLGAAKTSAYYAVAPFIGVLLSLVFLRESPTLLFWPALALMAVGARLASTDA